MMCKLKYFLCASLFIIVFSCNDSVYPTKIGSTISKQKSIPIATLFEDTSVYDGKIVSIQGVIDEQDPKGYWFYVQDGEARIYVEISNADFTIPDLTDKKKLVEGVVEVKMNIPSLLATGVEHQQ